MGASALRRHTTLLSIAVAVLLLARVVEQNLLNAELKPERIFQAPFEEHASWNTTTSTATTHINARREYFNGPAENATLTSFGGKPKESFTVPDRQQDAKPPSKPLDQARFALIQKAKMLDLKWIEADDHNRSHNPHRGARDADGNFGYVPDPTTLRKNPPPFHFDNLTQACAVRDGNYKMLTKNVFVDKAHKEAERSGRKRDKIFCLVYTTEQGHDMIPFIRETWG